jgi:hypothetical protein
MEALQRDRTPLKTYKEVDRHHYLTSLRTCYRTLIVRRSIQTGSVSSASEPQPMMHRYMLLFGARQFIEPFEDVKGPKWLLMILYVWFVSANPSLS